MSATLYSIGAPILRSNTLPLLARGAGICGVRTERSGVKMGTHVSPCSKKRLPGAEGPPEGKIPPLAAVLFLVTRGPDVPFLRSNTLLCFWPAERGYVGFERSVAE